MENGDGAGMAIRVAITDSLLSDMTAKPSDSKKARRRRFFLGADVASKNTISLYNQFFHQFSNKNTISPISGGFTFNLLGVCWVLLGIFGFFRASLGFFGLFGLFGLSPTLCQQARLRRGAKKLSDFKSKLSDNPTVLGHNCHPDP